MKTYKTKMEKYFRLILLITSFGYGQYSWSQNQVVLPNQWKLTIHGSKLGLGDLPIQAVVHPSKKFMVVINSGQSAHSLMVVDLVSNKITDSIKIDKTFFGGTFDNSGGVFYVSGAHNNRIEKYKFNNGKLKWNDSIPLGQPWPKTRIFPSGMKISKAGQTLWVGSIDDSSVYKINVASKKVERICTLNSEVYDLLLIEKKGLVLVSEWGNKSVSVINSETGKIVERIKVGANPTELLYDEKGNRVFISCSNDNTVHAINIETWLDEEILSTSLYLNSPTGSTPAGLAMDETNKRLFVANSDNNDLAVFDISKHKESNLLGFIPTGWYPTQVKIAQNKLWICNGKGFGSKANPNGPNPIQKKTNTEYQKGQMLNRVEYIGGLFHGGLQILDLQKIFSDLPELTKQVMLNTPFTPDKLNSDTTIPIGNPIPSKLTQKSPIKHVFYIIKENRTYDQVLSDVPGGDGDTSLLLFGETITPNQHKLVKDFVLLDHFYVDAEVSADGHNWSTAAIANDYTEKMWPQSYGGRGGNYVFEGQAQTAHPDRGFIWDHALRKGISYRTYGEFADDYKPNIKSLEGNFCERFTSWNEEIRDTTRFRQWKIDFDSLNALDKVPQLNTLRFINDHTEGVRKNRPTPFAHVADNDYAVGLFIEYLSKSSIWGESVVFILEDDAQNGPDHIDAHRSTAYVAGGYVKRNFVDHTPYSTSSMLRTIELILGMSPMSQYDAASKSMWRCFSDTVCKTAFRAVSPTVNLNDKNTSTNLKGSSSLMLKSELLDLDKEDEADEFLMNEILWKYVKGENSVMPPIKHSFVF